MLRVPGVVALVVAGAAASPASAAELTPDGPATLMNRWSGAVTAEGRPPEVLVGVRVTVGAGGREGTVRVRARSRSAGLSVAGDPVVLPAAPGTYDFPAPHIAFDRRSEQVGLDQTTGGHAIVEVSPCTPERGPGVDLCQIQWLDTSPEGADAPVQSRGGAKLAIAPVIEVDVDQDLRGDKTEDRTDLGLSATTTRDLDGKLRTAVVVTNNGPLSAGLPIFEALLPGGVKGSWDETCRRGFYWLFRGTDQCTVAELPAGASRTLTFVSDDPAGGAIELRVLSEGEDLAPADNVVMVTGVTPVAPAPAPKAATAVKAARTLTLRKGLKVAVHGEGRTRVTATFRVRGRTLRLARTVTLVSGVERTITLRAHGAKLRTLRRAAARGALRVTITARDATSTATATARVR